MWDRNALYELIDTRLRDHRLIVVANREPYIHRYVGDVVECMRPASGMATALDPMMMACGGTWVAHGSGDADRLTGRRRPGPRPAREPPIHPASGLADQGAGGGLLPRPGQQRALAPLPHRIHPADLQPP